MRGEEEGAVNRVVAREAHGADQPRRHPASTPTPQERFRLSLVKEIPATCLFYTYCFLTKWSKVGVLWLRAVKRKLENGCAQLSAVARTV